MNEITGISWFRGHRRGPALQTSVTNATTAILGAVAGIIVARFAGPSTRGDLAIALTVLTIVVQTCDLSVVRTGSYFVAKGRDPGTVFGTGIPILMLLAAVAVPASVLALRIIGYQGRILALNTLVLLAVPVFLIAGLASTVPLGLGRYSAWNLCRVLMPLGWVLVVVAIGFGLGNWDASTLLDGYVIVSVATTTIAVIVALQYMARLRFAMGFASEWVKYSASIHFGGLAATFNLNFDLVLVGAILGSRSAGIYAVAVGFAAPVTLVAASYAAIALPEVARRSKQEAYEYASGILSRALVFSVAIAVIGAVVAPELLPRIVGRSFEPAVAPFRVLLLAQIVLAGNGVLASVHLGMGRPAIPTLAEVASLALTVPLLIIFVPRWGIMAAAWICIFTYAGTFAVMWWYLLRFRHRDGSSDSA